MRLAGMRFEGDVVAAAMQSEGLRPLADEAKAGVFAYARFNDITARRGQKLSTQWTIGKNVDGSGAMSELVTVDEPPDPASGHWITARVNGEVTQDAGTDQIIFRGR